MLDSGKIKFILEKDYGASVTEDGIEGVEHIDRQVKNWLIA